MNEASPENDMAARLDVLLTNVKIQTPSQFQFGDGPPLGVDAFAAAAPSMGVENPSFEKLRGALATAIYTFAYARIYRGGPISRDLLAQRLAPASEFLAALMAANPTQNRWEPGWKVFQLAPNGGAHVQKGDRAVLAQPGQFAFPAGAGRAPLVGDFVDVLAPRESLIHQPGNYFAFGQTIASDYDFARIARFYFNAAAQDAPWLLKTIGELLNRHFIPYRFKCAVDPKAFDRTDGIVVYVARRYAPAFLRLIAPIGRDLEPRLRSGTPLLSRPMLKGMGAADDPATTGESFGQSISRLIADGLVDAWLAESAHRGRRDAVSARFAKAGLTLDRAHLARGLVDLYSWPTAGTA